MRGRQSGLPPGYVSLRLVLSQATKCAWLKTPMGQLQAPGMFVQTWGKHPGLHKKTIF